MKSKMVKFGEGGMVDRTVGKKAEYATIKVPILDILPAKSLP